MIGDWRGKGKRRNSNEPQVLEEGMSILVGMLNCPLLLLFTPSCLRVVVSTLDIRSDARLRPNLAIVLFPQIRSFVPRCLSTQVINGYRRDTTNSKAV